MEEQNTNEQFQNEEIKSEVETIENTTQEIKPSEKKSSGTFNKAFLILHIITLLAVAGLFCLYLTQNKKETKATAANPTATKPTANQAGGITAAYINTDSLWVNYEYAKDLDKEMVAYKNQMEKSYQNQIMAFQNEVENYKNTVGATLTLSEQKKTGSWICKKTTRTNPSAGNHDGANSKEADRRNYQDY